jgi:hypothetical protein
MWLLVPSEEGDGLRYMPVGGSYCSEDRFVILVRSPELRS